MIFCNFPYASETRGCARELRDLNPRISAGFPFSLSLSLGSFHSLKRFNRKRVHSTRETRYHLSNFISRILLIAGRYSCAHYVARYCTAAPAVRIANALLEATSNI